MQTNLTREQAAALLKEHNKERFHLQHALTVEGVMRWYAAELGYGEDAEQWALAGLLHDIDFEEYPEEHCLRAPEMLRGAGASEGVARNKRDRPRSTCAYDGRRRSEAEREYANRQRRHPP